MFPQVRFWTMRVATEIGEKRVAHSQAKEQEGMVPLKVDNEADHWNQIMIIIIMVIIPFLPISDLTVMSFWSKEIIVLKNHLFLVFFGHWQCHLLNVLQTFRKTLRAATFKLENLIRPGQNKHWGLLWIHTNFLKEESVIISCSPPGDPTGLDLHGNHLRPGPPHHPHRTCSSCTLLSGETFRSDTISKK